MFKKLIKNAVQHKAIAVLLVITLMGGGFFLYKKAKAVNGETFYVLEQVQKGTLIASVHGSGQTSSENQVDIKPKVSGDMLTVFAKLGQETKAGEAIGAIDPRDAEKAVKDAEVNFVGARIALNKMRRPPDASALLQAENALTNAQNSLEKLKLSLETNHQKAEEAKQKAQDTLTKTYDDAFTEIASAFIALPTAITKLHDILYSNEIALSENSIRDELTNIGALTDSTLEETDIYRLQSFQAKAESNYQTARTRYETALNDYKNTLRSADRAVIDALLQKTLDAEKDIVQAAGSERTYMDAWIDYRSLKKQAPFAKVTEYQNNLASSISQMNGLISSIEGVQKNIKDNTDAITNTERDLKTMDQNDPLDLESAKSSLKERELALKKLKGGADPADIASAERTIKEKEISLANLKAGTDPLDIQSQEMTLQLRRTALADAKEKLKEYTLSAPFDGIVAKIDVKQGDPVSPSSVVATIITKQKIALLSFNEIDASKIKIGQKATLTFDAIEDVSITGKVAKVDTLGTVSQGVVTYNADIMFDTQDDRVKQGMSVSAEIITDVRQNVLIVSGSAVKSQGNMHYVEMLENNAAAKSVSANTPLPFKTAPRRVPVEIGLANDTSIEIVSGLNEGDLVVTRTIAPSSANTNATQQAPSLFGTQSGGGRGGGFRIPR